MKKLLTILLLSLSIPVFAGISPQTVSSISVTGNSSDIVLSWPAVNTDFYGAATTIQSYNVYRSSDPNFVPDMVGGSNRIASPVSNSFTDIGAITSTSNFYYRITAVNDTADESLIPSDLIGKTRLDIVFNPSGSNRYRIALPESSSLTTADALANSASGISKVIRFDPASQTEQIWDETTNTGVNFPLVAGEGYAVEVSANTTLNILGVYSESAITLNHNAADFNRQWINMPQPSVYSTASDIAQALPDATKVTTFDTTNDTYKSWYKLDGSFIGENFPIAPGVSIEVSVTAASTWTPATSTPDVAPVSVPDIGYESITVNLTANASDADGSVASYQWDLNHDGVFDTTGSTAQFSYLTQGTHYPTVLVTDNDGHRAMAYVAVAIDSLNVNLTVSGFNPSLGESANVQYTLPLAGDVSIKVYDNNGALIKTLLNNLSQSAGAQSILWDGGKDAGGTVGDGAFFVAIEYTVGGFTSTFDTRTISGGLDNTQSITNINISNSLSPLDGDYVNIDYTLAENSSVTIEIHDSLGNLVKTLLNNQVQKTGINALVWDGTNNLGQIVASGTSFTVSIRSSSLATNSVITLGSAPVIANVSAAPLRFSPANNPYGETDNSNVVINFDLNKPAVVTLTVFDINGAQVGSAASAAYSDGVNQISWNGFKSAGVLSAAGKYTVQIQADSAGQLSNTFNVQAEIFY